MPEFLWDCFAVLGILTASACTLSGLSLAALLYSQFRQDRLAVECSKGLVVLRDLEVHHGTERNPT